MLLGELLVRERMLSPAQVEEGLAAQVLHGGRLGTNLLELGHVDEAQLARALGKQHGLNCAHGEIVPSVQALEILYKLGTNWADDKDVLPVRVEGTKIYLLIVNPDDLESQDRVAALSGKRVVPVVIAEFRMAQLQRRYCKAFRPIRDIDIEAVRRRKRAAAQQQQAISGDLTSEDEFQSLYAAAMRGGIGATAEEERLPEGMLEEELPEAELTPLEESEVAPPPRAGTWPPAAPPIGAWPTPQPGTAPAPRTWTGQPPMGATPRPAPLPAAPAPAPIPLSRVVTGTPAPAARQPSGAQPIVRPPTVPPPPTAPAGAPTPAPLPPAVLAARAARAAQQPAVQQRLQAERRAREDRPEDSAPISFAEAQKALATISDRDDIARIVLRFAAGKWGRALLLSVQREMAFGWHGAGPKLPLQTARKVAISLAAPSPFKLVRDSRSHFLGPLRRDPTTLSFLQALGAGEPKTALLMPILAAGRVVNILYADNGPGLFASPDIGELLILSQSVGRSYEAMIARRARPAR